MTIPYPDKPWEDNQQFTFVTSTGDTLTGSYYSKTNSWSFANEGQVAGPGDVLTTDVYTVPQAGDVSLGKVHFNQFAEPTTELITQQDVNWYLFDETETLTNEVQRLSGLIETLTNEVQRLSGLIESEPTEGES